MARPMQPQPQMAGLAVAPSSQASAAQALPSSVSLDLPPAIQQLVEMPATQVNEAAVGNIPTGVAGTNPNYPVLDFRMQPQYEMGGQVGPQGMPIRPAGLQQGQGQQGNASPQMLDMQINDMMNKNPEAVARIRAAIEAGLQSGELNQQELNMAIQLAQVVMQNPEMYPQIRQFAISRGLATEQDLPQQYDQGLVLALMMAAKAMQSDVQIEGVQLSPEVGQVAGQMQQPMQQPMQSAQMQAPMMSMRIGGKLPDDSPNADGSIPITAHEGEYVIPKHVVAAKGTEFFDSLLEKYKDKGSK